MTKSLVWGSKAGACREGLGDKDQGGRNHSLPETEQTDCGCGAAEYFIDGKLDVAVVLGIWILISWLGVPRWLTALLERGTAPAPLGFPAQEDADTDLPSQ